MAKRRDVSRIAIGDQELLVVELNAQPAPLDELTESENAIVRMVVAGKSNKEIAAARDASAKTVANQLRAIYEKLSIASRFELVALVESRR